MKKTLLLITLVFTFSAAFPQYQTADAVFEKITKEYTLNEDGSMEYHYVKQLKLLSHLSFNRLYGETFIVYNPDFQELKINEAYTILPDSTRVKTPDNAFNEVLPRSAAHSATYNNLREMVVTHTGTEIGATIYLDYTLITKKGYWPALMGNEVVQESSPVKEMQIIVNVPANVELQNNMFNLRMAPEIIVKGSTKVYTWKFSGLTASPKESFRGQCLPGTPRLIFSTAKNMADVKEWVAMKLDTKGGSTSELIALVDKVKSEEKDEIKVMLALQKYVVEDIATDHVSLAEAGFNARYPEQVWESNGGSQFEKSVLLATLLKLAEINAVPVLAAPQKIFDKEIGDLFVFEDVYVNATTKGHGDILLSATQVDGQALQFQLAGMVLIPLQRSRGELNEMKLNHVENKIDMKADIKIDDSLHLSGTAEFELLHAVNPFLELSENADSFSKLMSGNMVCKKEGSIKLANSNPAKTELSADLKSKTPPSQVAGYYSFDLPVMKNGFESFNISYLESERLDPFVLPFSIDENYTYSIEIPEGYEFVNRKVKESWKNKAGTVSVSISPKGNIVEITRQLKLDNKLIQDDQYAEFRELVNAWLDKNNRMVVFKKAVD
jgi:hypothetical protein